MTTDPIKNEKYGEEYLKHLRFIHFTLTIVCLALIITSYSDTSLELKNAKQQASSIVSNLKKIDKWREKFHVHVLPEDIGKKLKFAIIRSKKSDPVFYLAIDDLNREYATSVLDAQECSVVMIHTLSPDKIKEHVIRKPFEDKNLRDFQLFWNCLNDAGSIPPILTLSRNLKVLDRINYATRIQSLGSGANGDAEFRGESAGDARSIRSKMSRGSMGARAPMVSMRDGEVTGQRSNNASSSSKDLLENYSLTYSEIPPNKGIQLKILAAEISQDLDQNFLNINVSININKQVPWQEAKLKVKVTLKNVHNDYQEQIIKKIDTKWRVGQFLYSFSDLYLTTTDTPDLKLEKLVKLVDNQIKSERNSSVQVFGILVPTSSLKVWGSLILLVVQLYFLVHLTGYNNRYSELEIENHFPWIGVYNSITPRSIFCVSVLVLPLIAASGVNSHSESVNQIWVNDVFGWAVLAISLLLGVSTAIESIKINRKKLKFLER
ncbi:hypothetical protein MNBD_GAMMA12-3406 [hydrothermal vent metagenome]|uniref:Uncharacterized protein n=1 Tax=hydrothermal vent metagenome TaxID=652676 RepID=A0A3B0YCG2_9ZZZZ